MINDVVVGIRTIKCYGWEQHYLNKIKAIRERQQPIMFKFLLVGSLGTSLFQLSAILANFLILIQMWASGQPLELSKVYSLFACIFVLFLTVNGLTFLGTVALSNFKAIMTRYADLMK